MVLQSRLSDAIRGDLGGTYSITAEPDTDKTPKPVYTVRIDWTCDPARTESLVNRVFQEIDFVRNTPLTERQMTLVREGLLRELEQNSQSNRYFLREIARRYEDGEVADLGNIVNLPQRIDAMTAGDLNQAALRYLDTTRYVKVTLMPEARPQG
jgi:zinc protease